jgi:hypothetical protein
VKPQISQCLVCFQLILQPHVRYQLPDGAKLHLADVSAVYRRLSDDTEDNDSGSETGSESMLTVNNSVAEGEPFRISGLANFQFICICRIFV